MRRKLKASRFAWSLCGAVAIATVAGISSELANVVGQGNGFALAVPLLFCVLTLVFAVVAALILARQPRNTGGWLLLGPASLALLSALVESAGADYNDLRERK